MKITIETEEVTATIETNTDEMTTDQVLADLVIPAMTGVGFHKNSIDEAILCYGDEVKLVNNKEVKS